MKKSTTLVRNKNFMFYFFATFFGVLGEGVFGLTAIVLVLEDTNSIIGISKLLTLTLLPSVILAPFIGVLLDHFSRKSLLVICNLLRFFSIAAIPISYQMNFFQEEVFLISIFSSYIFWFILEPAKESVLKEILSTEQYGEGIAVVQGAWQVGFLSSAIIAGIMMESYGNISAIMLSSFTYIIGAILFMLLSLQKSNLPLIRKSNKLLKYVEEMVVGWRYITKNKQLLYFVLTTSMVLPFYYAINTLIVPFNFEVLQGSSLTLGVIDSGAGVGSLLSAVLCIHLSRGNNQVNLLIISTLLAACSIALFSITGHVFISFIMYTFVGVFIGNVKVLSRLQVYRNIEETYTGRVMTTVTLLSLLMSIIMTLVTAAIAEINLVFAYSMIAIFITISVIFTLLGVKATSCNTKAPLRTKSLNN